MRLLRSEEEIPPGEGGASMPVAQLERLARAWYGDRMDRDWCPRTRAQSQRVLDEAGLTDPFWRLG